MITTLVVLAVFIVVVVHYFLNFWRVRRYLRLIPGEPGYYLIGNVLDFSGSPAKIFKALRRYSTKYKIYHLWFSHMGAVCFTTPEDIEVVIASSRNIKKSRMYDLLMPWLSYGLLTSDGTKWRLRRKILTPTFHFNILQDFVNVFVRQTEVLIKELEPFSGDKGFNISPVITNFTLRTICETAMGIRFDLETEMQEKYEQGIKKMSDLVVHRIRRPWLYADIVYIFSPSHWQQLKVIKALHAFSKAIIQKRKSRIDEHLALNGSDNFFQKKKMVMLDMLLFAMHSGESLDFDDIREEVDTFIFEGHDTTSISLGFTLMLLASHPEVQEKVYQEICEVLGDSTRLPNYDDLQRLTYLEMCIKESLRLYPSVPMIARKASLDFETPSGYTIPKNAQLLVHIYDLHHSPDIYPNPEKFDPERFSPEEASKRHPFSFLAFSGGPRNCIGQRFAMLEMKAVICGIIRKFVLEAIDTQETITLTQEIMLRPKDGIKLRIKLRDATS